MPAFGENIHDNRGRTDNQPNDDTTIAGWLAGQIMEGYGFGLIGNIVVGIVGAVIAGWLLPRLGFVLIGGIGAAIINAVIGAVILLAVIGFFKRA